MASRSLLTILVSVAHAGTVIALNSQYVESCPSHGVSLLQTGLKSGDAKHGADWKEACKSSHGTEDYPDGITPLGEEGGTAMEIANDVDGRVVTTMPEFVSETEWANFKPNYPWTKIEYQVHVQHVTIQEQCMWATPGSETFERVVDASIGLDKVPFWFNIAWVKMSSVHCLPKPCRRGGRARRGSLRYHQMGKCHVMRWKKGTNITVVSDTEGNEYILHVTGKKEDAKAGVLSEEAKPDLPEGWKREVRVLEHDLFLEPDPASSTGPAALNGGQDKDIGQFACGFEQVFDDKGNGYHKFKIANRGPPSGSHQFYEN